VANPEFKPVFSKEMLETAKDILMGTAAKPRAKMQTCPFCHKRRRSDEKCCNVEYVKGSETPYITKTYVKRFQKKHHGQNRAWHIRETALAFFADDVRLTNAAIEMHVKVPDLASIPAFAEKYYLWKTARENRAEEKMKSASRRRNRD